MSSTDVLESINAYHCICTTLILVTTNDLKALPARTETVDGALMLPLPLEETDSRGSTASILQNVVADRKPIIIKRSDGFEKRILLKCQRCDLVIGYKLDEAHFESSTSEAGHFAYILPGGLVSTGDMKAAKTPHKPVWT